MRPWWKAWIDVGGFEFESEVDESQQTDAMLKVLDYFEKID